MAAYLWKVTRDANPTTTPFTNVRTLSLDASARAAIGFRGQRARCDVGSWPLWQLFPNLQRLLLLSLDFGSARMLTTQLAISSLQELTLSGYFYESVPYMVRELLANTPQLKMLRLSVREETIYPALDWTLKPLRHAALEELHLIGNLDFIVRQLRPLECPSLSRLCLGNFARGDASGSSIVAEVSAMVTRSLCQLETLELDWFDMPSYDMVRLLIGLPRLRSVKLYFRDMQPNDSLFATLFRMSADASFLQQMDSFQVLSNMVPFESSSLVESFAKFVEDPRRGGDGPFAPLRVATLKLGNNLF
ncbi:hypothetical protein CC2G_011013 [Coprinopsis cinerea AmutBmut pab1-1]|nr:hypothetical protein CC2G_011013 [Coprinopsis cinerea AmutBmut pab1-1]